MRLVIVGDIHFRAKKLSDISQAWHRAVNWAKKHDADFVIQAGDVFDRPNIFGKEADVGTICSSFLRPFNDPFCDLVLIPGNHDMGGPRDVDALAAFDTHNWIKVIHKPDVVALNDGLAVCAVPWVNKAKLMAQLIDQGMSVKEAANKIGYAMRGLLGKLSGSVKQQQDAGRFVLFLGHLEVTGASLTSGVQGGGTFEFSPSGLSGVGADAYALGHIHIRQHIDGLPSPNDGYLGTLCQLGFGEENNVTGFRYMEIEGRSIKADKFINNSASPKYFTVQDLSQAKYNEDVDYVKVKGEVKPESLPPRVQFEKIPAKAVAETRVSGNLTADSPMKDVIAAWASEAKCEVPLDKLAEVASDIEKQTSFPAEPIGALDSIEKICLTNIGSHKDTELDLKGVHGVIGIEGPTGSGKTTVLEALLVAFFGHCPSRPSLPNLIRNRPDVKEAAVEVEVVSAKKSVVARREFKKTPKTFSHKAYIFGGTEGSREPIAGPKVDDANGASATLIGDLDMILAGVFSAQDEMNNIVNLDPAPRKELFAKLLGTDKFIAMGETLGKLIKGDSARIEAMKSRIEAVVLELAPEEETKKHLFDLEASAKEAVAELRGRSEEVSELQEKQSNIKLIRQKAELVNSQIARLSSRQAQIGAESDALRQTKEQMVAIDEGKIRRELSKLRKVSEKLARKGQAMSRAEKAAAAFRQKAAEKRADAESVRASRMQAYADHKLHISKKMQEYKDGRSAKRAKIVEKLEALKVDESTYQERLKTARKQSEMLRDFPDLEECKACPLAKEGLQSRSEIPNLKRAVRRLRERISKGTLILEGYDEETKENADRLSRHMPESEWKPDLLKRAAELDSKAESIEKKADEALPTSEDQAEYAELSAMVADIPKLEKQLEEAGKSNVRIAKIDEKLSGLDEEATKIEEELKSLSPPEVPEEDYADRIDAKTAEKDALQERVNVLMVDIGKHRGEVEGFEKRKEELNTLRKELEDKSANMGPYEALAKAFSRDGIPQLIVDTTIPRLQEIMADLMSDFDATFSVQIRSQRETKHNKREVIDILVDDGYGERDIKTYSGGEKKLLKTIIRIAFATLQAERSGKGLKVLVLDEATDAMDSAMATSFINMVGRLAKSFNQIFVVSHNDYVISNLTNRIIFSVKDDCTKVILSRS